MTETIFPIQALGEYLLVRLDPEKTHDGRIELTPSAIEPVFTGIVVSRGPDVPDTVQVGCRVRWLFPLGSCFEMAEDADTQYARVHESDLVGVCDANYESIWEQYKAEVLKEHYRRTS